MVSELITCVTFFILVQSHRLWGEYGTILCLPSLSIFHYTRYLLLLRQFYTELVVGIELQMFELSPLSGYNYEAMHMCIPNANARGNMKSVHLQ